MSSGQTFFHRKSSAILENGCAYNEECVKHHTAIAIINSHQNTRFIELLIKLIGAIDHCLLAALPAARREQGDRDEPTCSSVLRMDSRHAREPVKIIAGRELPKDK
jgi:hypothetical protein